MTLFKKGYKYQLLQAYGTKKRYPLVIFAAFLVTIAALFYLDLIFDLDVIRLKYNGIPRARIKKLDVKKVPGYFVKTKGCQIPELKLFDKSIQRYLHNETLPICNKGLPPLVDSNLTSIFLVNSSFPAYGINSLSNFKCCYQTFWRVNPGEQENDGQVRYKGKCVYFKKKAIISEEFVRVKCFYNNTKIYTDFFAFAPKKTRALSIHNRLNVLVFGMDAISRLNLLRQMPKTVKYLEELGSVDMHGYTKVADNTFPNLIPVFTGLNETELKELCWPNWFTRFDKCPFIWKDFKRKHYTTAYAEDSGWTGTFTHLKNGFFKKPTDYVWYVFNYIAEQEVGNQGRLNTLRCIGSRLTFFTLLEYIDKFTMSMKIYQQPYFGFFWGGTISHDFLNTPRWGDDKILDLFKSMNASGRFDNTVLIFMSDHGIRWGGIRNTSQGRIEERMPFLHIRLPKRFHDETYQTARSNLFSNKYKLTTPFDLHETLVDLINPNVLTTEFLENRIFARNNNKSRGFSLFDEIPETRTCEDAQIEPHWCVCQTTLPINVTDKVVQEASTFIVKYMNDKLLGYEECAYLILDKILHAELKTHSENITVVEAVAYYTITLTTKPGGGIFESTVKQSLANGKNAFEITGTVSRLNLYGHQSDCITDFYLKLFCYCGHAETITVPR